MKWFKTNEILKDGWYWWKGGEWDYDPKILEVASGVIVDSRPGDSWGTYWEIYEHTNFNSGLWYGPIEEPPHITKEEFNNSIRSK